METPPDFTLRVGCGPGIEMEGSRFNVSRSWRGDGHAVSLEDVVAEPRSKRLRLSEGLDHHARKTIISDSVGCFRGRQQGRLLAFYRALWEGREQSTSKQLSPQEFSTGNTLGLSLAIGLSAASSVSPLRGAVQESASCKMLPAKGGNHVAKPLSRRVVLGSGLTLLALPSEILEVICSRLDHRALASLGGCCRPLHQSVNSDEAWHSFCMRRRSWMSAVQVEGWAARVGNPRNLAWRVARLNSLLDSWTTWKANRAGDELSAASDMLSSETGERLFWLILLHGVAAALTQVGVWYHRGQELPLDQRKAVSLFRMAAEQGHPRALLNLGDCYFRGWGVEKDEAQALILFKQADQGGETRAKYYLGISEVQVMGGSVPESARQSFVAGAKAGDVRALATLGYYHCHDDKFKGDTQKGIRYLTMAINDPRDDGQDGSGGADHIGMREDKWRSKFAAAFHYGICYEYGVGVPRSTKCAAMLYRISAEGGFCLGEAKLGRCFERGKGVPRDVKEGLRLRRLAESHSESFPELSAI
eukprot:TRINITY_DN3237_c0_g1_i8.p1 TRINITY_DN3237_c0_g1~~TRINITY_DN3237_c0_g1_i8.p1  ORF type:complete len:531 (-),score=44.36 TRINITY_DN3237_c0_g1_i8:3167-4759(-)